MSYKINNSELYHHGILGMKWGVRNAETRAKYASKSHKKGSKKKLSLRDRATKAGQRKAEKTLAKKSQQKQTAEERARQTRKGMHANYIQSYPGAKKHISVDNQGNLKFSPELKIFTGMSPNQVDDMELPYLAAEELSKANLTLTRQGLVDKQGRVRTFY